MNTYIIVLLLCIIIIIGFIFLQKREKPSAQAPPTPSAKKEIPQPVKKRKPKPIEKVVPSPYAKATQDKSKPKPATKIETPPTPAPMPKIKKTKPSGKPITIGFMGDVMLGRGVNEKIAQTYAAYPWGNLMPLLRQNDINIINLENTFTRSTMGAPKVFNFKSNPEHINTLPAGYVHVANLANNHSLDFSTQGLRETIAKLDEVGIHHVGAGATIQDAKKPAIIQKEGITVGIMGYTDNEPGWKALNNKPGTNYIKVGNIEALKKDIASVRDQVDILIVSIHWGPNMREHPSNAFQEFAHQIIDAGVDIIHGHSAHVVQGIEIYNGKVIMYDTGDFIDDYKVDQILRNDRSFLFNVTIDGTQATKIKLTPVLIKNMQVNLSTGTDKEATILRMKKRCTEFGTQLSDDGIISIN